MAIFHQLIVGGTLLFHLEPLDIVWWGGVEGPPTEGFASQNFFAISSLGFNFSGKQQDMKFVEASIPRKIMYDTWG